MFYPPLVTEGLLSPAQDLAADEIQGIETLLRAGCPPDRGCGGGGGGCLLGFRTPGTAEAIDHIRDVRPVLVVKHITPSGNKSAIDVTGFHDGLPS